MRAYRELPGFADVVALSSPLEELGELRTAARDWPVFAALLDVAEMSLATADRRLAEEFLTLGGRPDVAERVLAELDLTRTWLLAVLDQRELLERQEGLRTAVAMRTPYVDALSVVQLRALREMRAAADPEPEAAWRRVLLVAVSGVAAGLQNTG